MDFLDDLEKVTPRLLNFLELVKEIAEDPYIITAEDGSELSRDQRLMIQAMRTAVSKVKCPHCGKPIKKLQKP